MSEWVTPYWGFRALASDGASGWMGLRRPLVDEAPVAPEASGQGTENQPSGVMRRRVRRRSSG